MPADGEEAETLVDPEFLLWAMITGREGPDLHAVMMAHIPGQDNMLAYVVLCGAKGRFVVRPWSGEPKCEQCERRRRKLDIQG